MLVSGDGKDLCVCIHDIFNQFPATTAFIICQIKSNAIAIARLDPQESILPIHLNSQHVEGPADDPVVRDGILPHKLGPLELGEDDDEEEEEGI